MFYNRYKNKSSKRRAYIMNERKLELLVELLREMNDLQKIRERKRADKAAQNANIVPSTLKTARI